MTFHIGVALAVAALSGAFACSEPTLASPIGPVVPAGKAPPTEGFQPLKKPGTIYLAADSLYRVSQGYPSNLDTRFVLYDDGSFVLEFPPGGGYGGRYTRADSVVTFAWDGRSAAGPWGATGILRGDDLQVQYNSVMLLTDFMNGTYRRVRNDS